MMMMSVYRLALRLLPAELRGKHGSAMEELFVRETRRGRSPQPDTFCAASPPR